MQFWDLKAKDNHLCFEAVEIYLCVPGFLSFYEWPHMFSLL